MKNQTIKPMVVNRDGEVWGIDGMLGYADSRQFLNSLGSEQSITTLTAMLPTIIEQKYYTVKLAEYIDIEVGQGNPFATDLFNWTTGVVGDDFESGLVNMTSAESNTNADDIYVEPITRKATGWKKNVNYNIFQEGYFNAGVHNMDLVAAKYASRKKQYDLGFQKAIFFGLSSNTTDYRGLLNQSDVNSNTTLIDSYLKDMTADEFIAVIAGLLPAYTSNSAYTAMPNRFVIPAVDFYGLAAPLSVPLTNVNGVALTGSSRLEILERAMQQATGNADFKVLPSAYADSTYNAAITGLNKSRYTLYNKEPDSLICNVPLDFTVTLPGTANGFDYTSAAYSRFTTAKALRPLEMLYFDLTPSS